jgi:hypothetical protein
MKRKFSIPTLFVLLVCVPAFLLLTGCGGGGGSSSSSSGGSGTVAILLTDAPSDDFSVIELEITEISIAPVNEDDDWVVIFEGSEKFNLLDLINEQLLLVVSDDIPAGLYKKIRLRLGDYLYVLDPDGNEVDMELKIPSGKIDLNPKGSFEVVPGETLSITLDVDANKSVNFHKAGNSGKWIFRPVVFVEVETVVTPEKCPRLLKGLIADIYYAAEDVVEGFVLEFLGEGRDPLDVFINNDTVIFGEDGLRVVESDDITSALRTAQEEGLIVHVRGRLDESGDLQASVVVIGAVAVFKGTVGTVPYLDENDTLVFDLNLFPGQVIVDETIPVALSESTFVMTGCEEQIDQDAIKPGMTARVVGKIMLGDGSVQAIAVMLKFQRITGLLTGIEPGTEGSYLLTVQAEGDSGPVEVLMPEGTPLYMENIGEISLEDLDWFKECQDIEVSIIAMSDDQGFLTATDVSVHPNQINGIVEQISGNPSSVIFVDLVGIEQKARIPVSAVVEDQSDPDNTDPGIGDIAQWDIVKLFGFTECPDLNDPPSTVYFRTYMVVILPEATP